MTPVCCICREVLNDSDELRLMVCREKFQANKRGVSVIAACGGSTWHSIAAPATIPLSSDMPRIFNAVFMLFMRLLSVEPRVGCQQAPNVCKSGIHVTCYRVPGACGCSRLVSFSDDVIAVWLCLTGIFVKDILDAAPIDKYFELFKPSAGGEGGFVRIGMDFVKDLKSVQSRPSSKSNK